MNKTNIKKLTEILKVAWPQYTKFRRIKENDREAKSNIWRKEQKSFSAVVLMRQMRKERFILVSFMK